MKYGGGKVTKASFTDIVIKSAEALLEDPEFKNAGSYSEQELTALVLVLLKILERIFDTIGVSIDEEVSQ